MTIIVPNYLQTQKYSAKKDRRVNSAEVMREGIVRKGHYEVTQRGAGANMSVDVAAGEAWVKGDSAGDQGYYHVVNDATVNVAVTTANASKPRVDALVLKVNDSTEVGGSDEYKLEVIAGTPETGATLANLKGAPTPGVTRLLLAYILVGAAATEIKNASIGGLADPVAFNAELGTTKVEPYAIAGAPSQYAHGRPLDWVPGCILTRSAVATSNGISLSLAWNGEIQDTEEMHSVVLEPAKVFIKTPGRYLITYNAQWSSPVASSYMLPKLNGAPFTNQQGFLGGFATTLTNSMTSFETRLKYGDYLEMAVQQGTGAINVASVGTVGWQGI